MGQGPNALRLTFSYKDGVVQLVSENEVEMVVPPGDAPATAPEQGFWVEMQDASSNVLYRRVMDNPIPVDVEVFSNQHDRTVERVPGGPSEGMFTVVMPKHPNAVALALFSSHHEVAPRPAQPPRGMSPQLPFHAVRPVAKRLDAAQPVARFDLKKP